MTNSHKVLVIAVIAVVGIWGCAQGPSSADKIRSLELKVARLEEDLKTTAAVRDELRKKLTTAEESVLQMKQDSESLQTLLRTRTEERDQVTGQFDQFRKNLRELLTQMDAAASKAPKPPVTTVSQPKPPNS